MKKAKNSSSGRFMIALALLLQTAGCCLLLLTIRVDQIKMDGNSVPATIIGILFWVFLALSLLILVLCSTKRRRLERESENKTKQLPGVIRFFQNKPAIVSDILLFIALIATAAGSIFRMNEYFLLCSIVACLVLFCFHCWLNGKNYQFFKGGHKEKRNKEKNKELHNRKRGQSHE